MIKIHQFTFGPFQENTFLLINEDNSALVIDPGMSDRREQEDFVEFLQSNDIKLERLLLTHGHIDHVMGNAFLCDKFNLKIEAHKLAAGTIEMAERAAEMYGIPYEVSPEISVFLEEGDQIKFGDNTLDILFTPGHAPGHIVFVNHKQRWVVNGDVLFNGSVGRVDLPGSNPPDLVKSIKEKMYALPDDYVVYTGHGPSTTIGHEKKSNPFVNENTDLGSYF